MSNIVTDFKEIRAIIIPDDALNKIAVDLARKISRSHKALMAVNGKNFLPHITLYHAEYPIKNLPKIFQTMANLSKTKPFEIEFEEFRFGWGYVGISFKRNQSIINLHKQVVEFLSPLREGHLRAKYKTEITAGKYSPEQVKYIQKYGYQNVFDNFQPHLTLARFEDEAFAQETADKLNARKMKFKIVISQIGISEVGPHGTCTKILERFPLL